MNFEFDKKIPSDEEILQRKNFKKVLNNYQKTASHKFLNPKKLLWSGGTLVLVLSLSYFGAKNITKKEESAHYSYIDYDTKHFLIDAPVKEMHPQYLPFHYHTPFSEKAQVKESTQSFSEKTDELKVQEGQNVQKTHNKINIPYQTEEEQTVDQKSSSILYINGKRFNKNFNIAPNDWLEITLKDEQHNLLQIDMIKLRIGAELIQSKGKIDAKMRRRLLSLQQNEKVSLELIYYNKNGSKQVLLFNDHK